MARGNVSGWRLFIDAQRAGGEILAQIVAQAVDSGLGVVNLLLNQLSVGTIFRRERRDIGEQFGVTKDSGEWIADFVGSTRGQATEGNQLFGMRYLLLDCLKILDGLASETDQMAQFPCEQAELPIDQGAKHEHRAKNQPQSKGGKL